MKDQGKIRLDSVNVVGLFSNYDHSIDLQKDGLTIIHGPNGVGKTTVLRLIKASLDADLSVLLKTNFKSITLRFSNCTALVVRRETLVAENLKESEQLRPFNIGQYNQEELKSKEFATVTFELDIENVFNAENEQHKFSFTSDSDESLDYLALKEWANETPWLSRIGPREWRHRETMEILDARDLQSLYLTETASEKHRDDLSQLKSHVPDLAVYFIESQRLIITDFEKRKRHRGFEHSHFAIEANAQEMCEQIRGTHRASFHVSQKLERSFAKRVLGKDKPIPLTEEQLRNAFQTQVQFWQDLFDAGIIDPETISQNNQDSLPEALDDTQLKMMMTLVDDTELKQQPYSKLLKSAQLFLRIVNSRFSDKSIRCDAQHGFCIETKDGAKIPLRLLSSGEQHVVVLTYQLIFGIEKQSLILIDEPEISLHVDWQRKFLDEIDEIRKVLQHEFIIATHSPQIVGEHTDQMINLRNTPSEKQNA